MQQQGMLVCLLLSSLLFVAAQQPHECPPGGSLALNVPCMGHVTQGAFAYFSVNLAGHTSGTETLTVTVTPMGSSDPDLYCSLTNPQPADDSDCRATLWGADSLTITNFEGSSTLYLSVRGWASDSDFTIVAFFDGIPALIDGVPQSGHVSVGHLREYVFNISEHGSTVKDATFIGTPSSGLIQVLVGRTSSMKRDDTSTFDYATEPYVQGSPIVVPRQDNPKWPASGTFYVGVYGLTQADYAIVASTGPVSLSDGQPMQEHADASEDEYFYFNLQSAGCNLTFTVTPIVGDPDLYVARNIDNHRPSPSTCDSSTCYMATAWGEDSVTILQAEKRIWYIGVHAFYTSSEFTVLATMSCPGPDGERDVTLVDGVPQNDELAAGEWRYFSFSVATGHKDITLSLTRRWGDPDLYVKVGDRPTATNFTWRSIWWGEDLITIVHGSPGFCDHCTYRIGVYAATSTSFSLVASTTDAIISLSEGVPLREDLREGEYEYFKLDMKSPNITFTVSVTDLGQGDPDLFISTRDSKPNETSWQWSAQRLRGDAITISHDDPKACRAVPCTYWISVHAITNSTFVIVANFDNVTTLNSGVPLRGSVSSGAFRYYRLLVPRGERDEVTFSLTLLSGLASLLVSQSMEPTVNNYGWFAPWYSANKTIDITPEQHAQCPGNHGDKSDQGPTCAYLVGVLGVTDANFSVTGTILGDTNELQNGEAVVTHIETGDWDFYSFKVENVNQSLVISITAFTGDPDLYIAPPCPESGIWPIGGNIPCANDIRFNIDSRPRESHQAFYIGRAYGADVIDIGNEQQGAPLGVYLIAINAFQNSTFSVMALLTDPRQNDTKNVMTLSEMLPQQGFVQHNHYNYYRYGLHTEAMPPSERPKRLHIALTKSYGDPDLYVSLNSATFPTIASHMWASTHFANDLIQIDNPLDGEYVVGVFGYQASSYTLMATAFYARLLDGVPMQGRVQTAGTEHDRYQFYVSDFTQQALELVVTAFDGWPDVYVSQANIDPSAGDYAWKMDTRHHHVLLVPLANCLRDGSGGCSFWISVYAIVPTTYTIMASLNNARQLEDGVPLSGQIPASQLGQYRRYWFVTVAGDTHRDLKISLQRLSGSPSVYLNSPVMHDPLHFPFPNTTQYDARQVYPNTGSPLWVRHGGPLSCHGTQAENVQCLYKLSVYCTASCDYNIVFSREGGNIILYDGVPMQAQVDGNMWEYYLFTVTQSNLDLIFTLTPIFGDPDIFVSNLVEQPDAQNCIKSSRNYGADIIIIPDANYSTGFNNYYVGVQAFVNTSYVITAYVEDSGNQSREVLLQNGQPQSGFVEGSNWRFYRWSVSEEMSDVTFTVSRVFGDPDIYVRANQRPTLTEFDYVARAWGKDILTVSDMAPGDYYVGIYGFTDCQFTIVASSEDQPTLLREGVSFRENLFANELDHFVFPVDDVGAQKDLTVTVTAWQGDPDLYIGFGYVPTTSVFNRSARSYLEDAITISHTDLVPGDYYITVHAFTNCSFTILATYNTTITLAPGQSQTGALVKGAAAYYTLEVRSDSTVVRFALLAFSGTAYLYVANDEHSSIICDEFDCHGATWRVEDFWSQSQTLQILPGSPGYRGNAIYNIAVFGAAPTTYTLTAWTSDDTLPLTNGVSQWAWVRTGEWSYFSFDVMQKSSDVIIAVTPMTGDPDLFVLSRTDQRIVHPNATTASWISAAYGGDVVLVEHTDPDFCLPSHSVPCTFYIGVYAFQNSTFTITAYETSYTNQTIVLAKGQPQTGAIGPDGAHMYYRLDLSPSEVSTRDGIVTFTLSALVGDPDMRVQDPMGHTNESRSYGSDSLSLPFECLEGQALCSYLVDVWAFTAPTHYTLTATTGWYIRQLQNGVKFDGRVGAGMFDNYKLIVDRGGQDITVSCTAISGDPDLYISWLCPRPAQREDPTDPSSFCRPDASRINYGSDVFVQENAPVGVLYIAVAGFMSNTTYSITATLGGADSPTVLAEGEPQVDVVYRSAHKRYAFTVTDVEVVEAVTITVNSMDTGVTEMYIAAWPNTTWPDERSDPDKIWSTTQGAGSFRNVIRLDSKKLDDKHVSWNSTFRVTVRGIVDSQYEIGWNSESYVTTLTTGSLVVDYVANEKYNYYRYTYDPVRNSSLVFPAMRVETTQYSGAVDVVAKFLGTQSEKDPGAKPSVDNCFKPQCYRASPHGGNVVQITVPEMQNYMGKWMIGVYGLAETAYAIKVSSGFVTLPDNQVLYMAAQPDGDYFVYNIQVRAGEPLRDIRIDVFDKDRPSLPIHVYMSISVDFLPGQSCTDEAVCYKAPDCYDIRPFSLPATDAFYNRSVARQCPSGYTSCSVQFFFLVIPKEWSEQQTLQVSGTTTPHVPVVLGVNSSDSRTLVSVGCKDESGFSQCFQYYEMPIVAQQRQFVIWTEPCTGGLDIYGSLASDHKGLPGPSYFLWPGQPLGPFIKTITAKKDWTENDRVYVAVQANENSGRRCGGDMPSESRCVDFKVHATADRSAVDPQPVKSDEVFVIVESEQEVVVEFNKANPPQNIGADSLKYFLYWALEEDAVKYELVLYSPCGLEYASNFKTPEGRHVLQSVVVPPTAFDSDGVAHVKVDGKGEWSSNSILLFNALVQAGDYGSRTAYRMYRVAPTSNPSGSGLPMKIVLGAGIPVFLIVISGCVYLIVRNRRLSKELEIEMHDAPKGVLRKAVRGPPSAMPPGERTEKGPKRYSRLLEEEEDEGVGHQYDPPEL